MFECHHESQAINGIGRYRNSETGIRIYTHTMEVEVYWDEWCPLNESSYQAARTLYVAACIHEMLDEKERHALIIAEIEDSDIIVEGDGETEDLFDFQVLKITEE